MYKRIEVRFVLEALFPTYTPHHGGIMLRHSTDRGSVSKTHLANIVPPTTQHELAAIDPVHNSELSPNCILPCSERLIRLPEVIALLGISRSTIYRYIAAKRFPLPIRLSTRCIAWKVSSIETWLATLIAG
jgi:prophage regulatory protein